MSDDLSKLTTIELAIRYRTTPVDDFIDGPLYAIMNELARREKEGQQYQEDYQDFIDKAWQIAREGAMGEWDYPAQVLRHLQERKNELLAEVERLRTENARLQAMLDGVDPRYLYTAKGR